MDNRSWPDRFQEAGAFMAGQGPQYLAARTAEDRTDLLRDDQRRQAMLEDGRKALLLGRVGKWGEVQGLMQNRLDLVTQLGGDPSGSADMLRMTQEGKHDEALAELQTADDMAVLMGTLPSMDRRQEGMASAKTMIFDNGTVLKVLPDGSTEVTDPSGNVVVGNDRITALKAARNEQVAMAAAKASATKTAEGEASGATGRAQEAITLGVEASKSMPLLRRSMELLSTVKTGGWEKAALTFRQWSGTESADEAELTSNMGRAVLSQLKATFGSQFTEKEGKELAKIEAGLGKSAAGNMRIMNQLFTMAKRKVKHGIDAAVSAGDYRAAAEMQDYMDMRIDDAQATELFSPRTKTTNDRGWKLMTDANGNKAYVGPNGEIEEIQ